MIRRATANEEPMESFIAMLTGWEELDIDPEEEHKQHMQYAVDKSTAGYYRLNKEGKFIDVNRAWLDLYKCKDKRITTDCIIMNFRPLFR